MTFTQAELPLGCILAVGRALNGEEMAVVLPFHGPERLWMQRLNTLRQQMQECDMFKQYQRKQIAELRPYVLGEDMKHISVAAEDVKAGSPKDGDMIARNPKNHLDQWLVAAAYFKDNFEPL